MKRNPRKVRWTKAFRKAAGKEMTIVSRRRSQQETRKNIILVFIGLKAHEAQSLNCQRFNENGYLFYCFILLVDSSATVDEWTPDHTQLFSPLYCPLTRQLQRIKGHEMAFSYSVMQFAHQLSQQQREKDTATVRQILMTSSSPSSHFFF